MCLSSFSLRIPTPPEIGGAVLEETSPNDLSKHHHQSTRRSKGALYLCRAVVSALNARCF